MSTNVVAANEQGVGEEDVRDPALGKIRDLLYRVSGIYQRDDRMQFLASRCRRRMKAVSSGTFADYFESLTGRANRDAELRSLLNEVTVGETSFFRNAAQIEALTKIILPKLTGMAAKQSYKKIRMWSAGCSTGEEAYTLSMVLLEQVRERYAGWSFEIVATDLNDNALAKCREGIYGENAVRNTSEELRAKYFERKNEKFRVRDEVRAGVKFERLNLQDQTRMLFMKGFDAIFCCNVMIYFDGASKKRVLEHFYSGLLPGGYFFLGHSESLHGMSERLRFVHFPDATAYRKPLAGETPGDPA